MAKKSDAIDMTQGRPISLMLRFALPMMIGSVFQSLYTMVDSAVLGRYVGSQALAAIGATSSTVYFLLLLSTSVTSAVSIVVSQFVGANDLGKIRAGVVSTIYLTFSLSAVIGLISIFAARPLMLLLDAPESLLDMSVLYIQIIGGVSVASFAYNAVSSILRALGDSKTPLIFLIVCSLLNVVFDLFAVLALDLGVAGVAIATVAAQAISAVACTFYMYKKHPELALKKENMRPDFKVLWQILGMGLQMALQGALLSIGMMFITRIINGFGETVVAAFTVGSNVQNLAVMLFANFSFGFSVYVGQNYGARLSERIRRGVREIFLLVGGLSALACVIVLIFQEPLVLLYVKPEETAVVEASLSFVRVQAWFFPFLGWIWLYNSTLKGMGKIGITMVSSFVELGSKIAFTLILPIWMGYTGIWYAAPIGYILGLLPDLIYYYSGRWEKKLREKPAEA